MVLCPAEFYRAACAEHGHSGGTGGLHRLQKLKLPPGKADIFPVSRPVGIALVEFLAFHGFIQSQHNHSHIALFCGSHRFGNAVVREGKALRAVLKFMAALGIVDADRIPHNPADSVQRGDVF